MKKILVMVVTVVLVATTWAFGSSKKIQGIIKNSSEKSIVVKDLHNDQDLNLPVGASVSINPELGVDVYVPIFYLNRSVIDTVIVKMKFMKDGDVFELKSSHLVANNLTSDQTVQPGKQTGNKSVGKRVTNELDGILFFQDRGLCLAPGETSKEPVKLNPDERIVIEKNYRLFFLEINDFFAENDKVYIVDEETLISGNEGDKDSVILSLTTGARSYVFIDDLTKEVKGIRPLKGRGGFSKNFLEGANTIMMQVLDPDGTVQIRYYTFMASRSSNYVCPPASSFDDVPLFYGGTKNLAIAGFDKNCSIELFNNAGKSVFGKVIIDENDTAEAKPFFLGINKVRVTFYERTAQGRVRYSYEYFKLVSETDSIFQIDPNYFWSLEGKPVLISPENNTKSKFFQEIELWAMNKEGNPQNIVIKRDFPSEKVYIREGIAHLPGKFIDGLNRKNLTATFIISEMDKGKAVKIQEENINRKQQE